MITYSKLGQNGRLGNQLFQIAGIMGIAAKYGVEAVFPHWKYASFFKKGLNHGQVKNPIQLKVPQFHFDLLMFDSINWDEDVDVVTGHFQSEEYFKHCEDLIREQFQFSIDGHDSLFKKPSIAIHVRHGDYIGNENYVTYYADYFLAQLDKYFSGWDGNVYVFSDNPSYCKYTLKGCHVFEGNSEILDLYLMSRCDHFIISNSSYSWWGAWLGEKDDSIIVRPPVHFAGPLSTYDTSNLYPGRWKTGYPL